MIKPSCTGVILAGGLNTRFSGRNKAFASIDGRRIIEIIHELFRTIFDEIILVTNNPGAYMDLDALIVTDHYPDRSSLTGIHAAMFNVDTDFAFISACDTPFLQRSLVALVVSRIASHIDVVIPETQAGLEPLCAAYSRRCLEAVSRQIQKKQFKIQGFFNRMNIRTVSEKALRTADPDLVSFFNINTPEDLARANALLPEKPLNLKNNIDGL